MMTTRFLQLPERASHSYALDWPRLLASKNSSALPVSLQILRPTTAWRQNAPRSKVPAGQKTLRCKVYGLGPKND